MSRDTMYPSASFTVEAIGVNLGQTLTVYLNPNQPFMDGPADIQSVELRVRHDGTLELFVSTDAVKVREWADGWESLVDAFNASRDAATEASVTT